MKKYIKFCFFCFFIFAIVGLTSMSYATNLDSDEYKITTKENVNYVIGIFPNTKAKNVKDNLKTNTNIEIFDNNGNLITEEKIIATGNKIQVGNTAYIAIVCGDINGDGELTLTDLVKVKSHLIGKDVLTGVSAIATDVDANGKLTSTDILKLKRLLVRVIEEREIFETDYINNEYSYKTNRLTDKITINEITNTKASGTLQIPNKIDGNEVKEIGVFLGENNNITKVTIPTGIEEIGNTAFSGLGNLQAIEVSGLNENYCSEEGILYNKGKDTLVYYPRGKEGAEYTIGEEVKTIEEFAFYKNNKIDKLYLTDNIENLQKNAFQEMKGKVYIKEGAKIINKLEENGIDYKIDAKPEITKLTSSEVTNQEITLNIEATDDIGIVAWSVALKGNTNIEWKEINQTKKLTTTYANIKQNGTYVLRIKDNVGNIESKEIIIDKIDTSIPKMTSIKIVSPESGECKIGQEVIIRVQFNEKIKGTAPTLTLLIGDTLVTATAPDPTGTLDYIDYTYTIAENLKGSVEIGSYIGGDITDLAGNKATIFKLLNSGNHIEIDTLKPEMTSIKIISPASGVYKAGQKITIRVQFSEKIKGIAPVLKLRIGDSIVTAIGTNPTGETDYIDYSYITTYPQKGKVEIESYAGGRVTDFAGNKATIVKLFNTGNYIEINTTIPKMTSIKIISPASGEYKAGQKITIRVQFSEKIKGIAPTLTLRIGNSIVTATRNNPKGTSNYIDYTYITTYYQKGMVEIENYIGGNITDLLGNRVNIFKLPNTGNKITIKARSIIDDIVLNDDVIYL